MVQQPFEIMEMFSDRSFTELAKIRFGKDSLFQMDYFIDFMRSNLRTRNLEDLEIPVVMMLPISTMDNVYILHVGK